MNDSAPSSVAGSLSSLGSGSDPIYGMAVLGKTVLSLAFIVLVILALSYLLKRLNGRHRSRGELINTVASSAVGPKERVVVVEVDKTWLVLGVGGGNINKLHQMPRPEDPPATDPSPDDDAHFGRRFLQALSNRGDRNTR